MLRKFVNLNSIFYTFRASRNIHINNIFAHAEPSRWPREEKWNDIAGRTLCIPMAICPVHLLRNYANFMCQLSANKHEWGWGRAVFFGYFFRLLLVLVLGYSAKWGRTLKWPLLMCKHDLCPSSGQVLFIFLGLWPGRRNLHILFALCKLELASPTCLAANKTRNLLQ